MNLRLVAGIFFAAIAGAISSPAGAAYTISISGPASGHVGDNLAYDVNLSMGAADAVNSVNFNIDFNPGMLHFNDPGTPGAFVSSWALVFPINEVTAGSVGFLASDSFEHGFIGTQTLATLRFDLLAPGQAPLTFSNAALGNNSGDISGFGTNPLSVNVVAAVPEPETWVMMALAAALILWRMSALNRSRACPQRQFA